MAVKLCLLYNELTNGHLVLSKGVVMAKGRWDNFYAKRKAERKAKRLAAKQHPAKPKREHTPHTLTPVYHATEATLLRKLDDWE